MTTLRTLVEKGVLRGVGLYDIGDKVFILGITQPTESNTGVPPGTVLTPYDDRFTPRVVNIDTPGVTITDTDFGNVRLYIRAANVTIKRCRWTITDIEDDRLNQAIISCDSGSVTNLVIEESSFVTTTQEGWRLDAAIRGHDFTAYRCFITGTQDGIRPNIAGNWRILGCFIGFLGWWAADVTGKVHPSDVQTHSDCIQTTFGGGEVMGNTLLAYPSLTVGTGTPGSGNDSGNPKGWYTQAQADARRAELMDNTWTDASKSYGNVSRAIGGVLCPLMCNTAAGSTPMNLNVTRNWFGGGNVHVNGLASNLVSPLGTFRQNRHYDDSKFTVGDRAIGYRIREGLFADIPQTGDDVNTYMDGGIVPIV